VGIHLCLNMRFWTGSFEIRRSPMCDLQTSTRQRQGFIGSVNTGFCEKKSNGPMTKSCRARLLLSKIASIGLVLSFRSLRARSEGVC